MSVITSGKTFANGEQLSADKLNLMLTGATFSNSAVDLTSTLVDSNGAIVVRDSGITTAKLADTAVTTAKIANGNVTKAKIEDVADMKVLGNTSGSATAPQEVSILDEDDMESDSDTALATQQSIKAYVDSAPNFTPSTYAGEESVTLPNGLIMKFGTITGTGGTVVTYGSAFPNAVLSVVVTCRESYADTYGNATFVTSSGTSSFTITNGRSVNPSLPFYWQAIGY